MRRITVKKSIEGAWDFLQETSTWSHSDGASPPGLPSMGTEQRPTTLYVVSGHAFHGTCCVTCADQ